MRTNIQFLWINIIGGVAVLGGYVYALLNHPDTGNDLWGGIPQNWRAWIVTSMFIAAFGYIIACLLYTSPSPREGWVGCEIFLGQDRSFSYSNNSSTFLCFSIDVDSFYFCLP